MNELVTQKTQLPAHLAHLTQNTALMSMNAAASAGISAGGWPRISIKGGRFRLQTPQGEEVVVNKLDLDVIVIEANPHGLSKTYYAGSYDPSVEDKAPDCYSDNGIGPSSRAAKPQCGTCAACPHNVWGSKINPSGSSTKSCGDSKKVAVLIAENPDGPAFELRVPAASLKNWGTYVESLNNRGIPAAAVVTKLTFDTAADYPKLLFTPSGWATPEQVKAIEDVIGSEEAAQCTGRNDKPVSGPVTALPAPAPIAAAPALPPMPPVPAAPLPVMQVPASPFPPAPQASLPLGPTAQDATPKRTRKAKTDTFVPAAPVADNTPLPPFLANAAPASALPPLPPSAAAQAAPLTAPVTNSALDDLIARAIKI